MRRIFLFILVFFTSTIIFANSTKTHPQIKELSRFRMMGEVPLRAEPNFNSPILYTTINHEGGMKLLVIECGKKDVLEDSNGQWYKILTLTMMWVESRDKIEKNSEFWIFIPDDMPIFYYEEL